MQNKTIEIEGQAFVLAPISVGAAREMYATRKDNFHFNVMLVANSLGKTEDEVNALPFYSHFNPLLDAAMEVNGLKKGETQGAAASTSDGSTAASPDTAVTQ